MAWCRPQWWLLRQCHHQDQDFTPAHLDTASTLKMFRGVLSALALTAMARPLSVCMHGPRLTIILCVLGAPTLPSGLHNPLFLLFRRGLNFRMESLRDALATMLGSASGIVAAVDVRSYWTLVMAR